jgi:hypothetical protein
MSALISRPTLLHWPRFWKGLIKTIVGKNVYNRFTKIKASMKKQ